MREVQSDGDGDGGRAQKDGVGDGAKSSKGQCW